MTGIMALESKQLYMEVKANENKYVNEELDFSPVLKRTDQLYEGITSGTDKPSANEYLQDSDLLTLETKIVRQSARSYKIHNLSFDPRSFSTKTRNFFGMGNSDENPGTSQRNFLATLWTKLGECSKEIMYTVPNFNYLYGTFDADPLEPLRKKRKQTIKDKIGKLTKPKEVGLNEASASQDIMCHDASRILTCFIKLTQKSKRKAVCFYEFVIDPTSFTRTVEYVFLVSLLVQHGDLCIFADDQGLPYIKKVESKDSDVWSSTAAQTALSISMDEWKSLIQTFNFKTPVIPPRTTN